jgi:hypothetical protein
MRQNKSNIKKKNQKSHQLNQYFNVKRKIDRKKASKKLEQ